MGRGTLSRLLLLLGALAFAGRACAQGVSWDVTVGFDNTFKSGAWTPVFVDISNEGASRTGQIVVPVVRQGTSGAATTTNYVIPVELPQHARKRYILTVTSERLENVYLNLSGLRDKRALARLREAAPEDTLVAVVGGDPGLLRFLSGTEAVGSVSPGQMPGMGGPPGMGGRQGPGEIVIGHAGWDALPDSWLGWDGVDAVVLGDAGFAGASQEAQDALLQWLQLGGTLIVPGGSLSPAMATSPIGRLLPIQITGTQTLPDLAALGRWAERPIEPAPVLAAAGALQPDAEILCASSHQPLIVSRPVGAGRIVLTSFDFTAAPVKHWDGLTTMWPRLLAQAQRPPSLAPMSPSPPAYPSGYYPGGQSLADVASYTPQAQLPPMWLILGFLVAYIVVLVPVNYIILRRLDRRELAWLTTPLIVAIFTVGAYATGYGIRGGDIILNRLGILETQPGASLARGRGYLGLFSPSRTTYEILLEGTAAGARDLASEQQRVRAAPTVVCGPQGKITNIAMNMWTSRPLGVEFLADLQGGVSAVCEFDGTNLRAQVKNATGLRLTKCRIVQAGQQGKEEDLSPGRQAETAFTKGSTRPLPDPWSAGQYPPGTRGPRSAKTEDLAVKALLGGGPWAGGGPPGPPGMPASGGASVPYLVAVSRDPLVPAKLAAKRAKVHDTNILVMRLPVRLAAGRHVAVPEGMITSRIVSRMGTVSFADYAPGLSIENGFAVLEYRVPVGPAGGKATRLVLTTTASPGSAYPAYPPGMGGPPGKPGAPATGGGPQPVLRIWGYNFAQGKWERLASARAADQFAHPQDSMTPDGRVLVKFEAASGQAQVQQLALKAEVDAL